MSTNTDFNVELPDERGHFGIFGGRFVSETLTAALDELQSTYEKLREDPEFQAQFDSDLAHYVGRPSPLYLAQATGFNTIHGNFWVLNVRIKHTNRV